MGSDFRQGTPLIVVRVEVGPAESRRKLRRADPCGQLVEKPVEFLVRGVRGRNACPVLLLGVLYGELLP
jgi:hypothetical protein